MTTGLRNPRLAALAAILTLFVAPDAAAQRRPLRDRVAQEGAGRQGAAADRHTVHVDGRTRRYLLRVPQQVARGTRPLPDRRREALPLVIALHGGGGNADNAERMTGFSALVERERLIVAYPDGSGRLTRGASRPALLTWNADHCCGFALQHEVDDVAFVAALIDSVSAMYPVDAARIYVTGMSNGAMMAHRLGRELSHRVAAIAPVVGAVFGDEPPPASPVSAIMINGLRDASVPANGGPPGGPARSQWDGTPARPNVDQGAYWARANGCRETPVRSEQDRVITWRWPCPAGLAVEVHQLRDGGHAWPGGQRGRPGADATDSGLDATRLIWAFFQAHPKRAP